MSVLSVLSSPGKAGKVLCRTLNFRKKSNPMDLSDMSDGTVVHGLLNLS